MQTFKLDEFNNLIGIGSIHTISEETAVKQDIKTLLKMFQTEYPFDNREGIPYYFLARRNNRELTKGQIIARVLTDARVKSIKSITVNFVGGNMQVSLEVILNSGVVVSV